MDPIFKKCLLAIEKINEDSFPNMELSYKSYIEKAKSRINGSQCLNESRAIAKSAIEALNSGQIDNRNVKKELDYLSEVDKKINYQSKELHELLGRNKSTYIKRSKELARKNHNYLNEMKNGTTPAQELLQEIIKLAKEVQKTTNEEIPALRNNIESFMKKAENKICDDAFRAHNKIQKLDSGTLPRVKTREWTYVPDELFSRSGAFVNTEYDKI